MNKFIMGCLLGVTSAMVLAFCGKHDLRRAQEDNDLLKAQWAKDKEKDNG